MREGWVAAGEQAKAGTCVAGEKRRSLRPGQASATPLRNSRLVLSVTQLFHENAHGLVQVSVVHKRPSHHSCLHRRHPYTTSPVVSPTLAPLHTCPPHNHTTPHLYRPCAHPVQALAAVAGTSPQAPACCL